MLSLVARDFFGRSPVLALPIAALLLFLVVFVATSLRALLARKQDMARLAALPMDDERGAS